MFGGLGSKTVTTVFLPAAGDETAPKSKCCGDSGGRAGLLTKPYKIEQVQIL